MCKLYCCYTFNITNKVRSWEWRGTRSDPGSEPFVGQARWLRIEVLYENIFLILLVLKFYFPDKTDFLAIHVVIATTSQRNNPIQRVLPILKPSAVLGGYDW